MCADVSLWLDDVEQRIPCEEIFRVEGFRFAGYLVDEVVYTEYGGNRHSGPRDWPDGQRSPGIIAVTLMERPKRLSREEWIRRWHGKQSPVSEAMQPRTRYVRNVVIKAVTPDVPPYEGIVEEAWASAQAGGHSQRRAAPVRSGTRGTAATNADVQCLSSAHRTCSRTTASG